MNRTTIHGVVRQEVITISPPVLLLYCQSLNKRLPSMAQLMQCLDSCDIMRESKRKREADRSNRWAEGCNGHIHHHLDHVIEYDTPDKHSIKSYLGLPGHILVNVSSMEIYLLVKINVVKTSHPQPHRFHQASPRATLLYPIPISTTRKKKPPRPEN